MRAVVLKNQLLHSAVIADVLSGLGGEILEHGGKIFACGAGVGVIGSLRLMRRISVGRGSFGGSLVLFARAAVGCGGLGFGYECAGGFGGMSGGAAEQVKPTG